MNPKNSLALFIFTLLLLTVQSVVAFEYVERSRDQFSKDSSYFVYPLAVDIPGLGKSAGVATTILNIKETDLDFTGFLLRGDFDVTGGTFLNYHILDNRLLFDVGVFDFEAAIVQFDRGINSNEDDTFTLDLNGQFFESQLTWTFEERHIESFLKLSYGNQQVTDYKIENADGSFQSFPSKDSEKRSQQVISLGFRFDNTNDRLHPRQGYRLEMALKIPKITDEFASEFVVTDYNATFYVPFRSRDTLAFNLFRSDAHVTNEVVFSKADLRVERGIECGGSAACELAETRAIDQRFASNKYGTATSIGGTQRLRSFSNNRYYAGHSMFYGIEYRMELNDQVTPFDFYVAKGTRTGLQLAFFAEQGSVAERTADLFDTIKTSYGVGFRVVLSGVILRADYSNGSEGDEFLIFLDYPWSLLSIDS